MSCIYWTQFEDIVLAALRLDDNKYKIYIRGSDGEIHVSQDICFADDLTTFSTTIEGLQRKARIVGAFAETFRLQISVKKLRQVGIDFGQEEVIPEDCHIEIDDGNKTKTMVSVPKTNDVKILGYTKSFENGTCDENQFIKTLGTLSTLCATIARKKASPEAKMIALTYRVFNVVLYQAQLSPWSLAQCRKLDIPVNKLLCKITHNM